MNIHILRADYVGTLADLLSDNGPFLPDGEAERLTKELKANGKTVHVAHSAGAFEIVRVD